MSAVKKSKIDWLEFNSEFLMYKEIVIRTKQGWDFSRIQRYCNITPTELKERMKTLRNYRDNIFDIVKTKFELK